MNADSGEFRRRRKRRPPTENPLPSDEAMTPPSAPPMPGPARPPMPPPTAPTPAWAQDPRAGAVDADVSEAETLPLPADEAAGFFDKRLLSDEFNNDQQATLQAAGIPVPAAPVVPDVPAAFNDVLATEPVEDEDDFLSFLDTTEAATDNVEVERPAPVSEPPPAAAPAVMMPIAKKPVPAPPAPITPLAEAIEPPVPGPDVPPQPLVMETPTLPPVMSHTPSTPTLQDLLNEVGATEADNEDFAEAPSLVDDDGVDLLHVWRPSDGDRTPPPIDEAAIAKLLQQNQEQRGSLASRLMQHIPKTNDEETTSAPLYHPEEAPEPEEAWQPTLAASSSQASFAAHSALSLISMNLTQDADELNDALSALGSLGSGQKAMIRTTFRAYPEASSEIAEWVMHTKTGGASKPKGAGGHIVGWFSYIVQYFIFSANASGNRRKGRLPPSPPHRVGGDVKPIATNMMADETKQAIKEAESKGRDSAHFEVAQRILVVGAPDQAEELDQIRAEIEAGFDAYATQHQRIVWEPCPPILAAVGFMSYKQSNNFILSAKELGEIARVPDDLTNPGGVTVQRARVKPLSPPNPIIVQDPINPPPGVIPLGVINPNTEDQVCVGMRNKQLDKHLFGVGRTGSGKSIWLQYVVHGIAKADYPIVIIDPHGNFAEDLKYNLIMYCPERVKDIVFIDCSDPAWPMAFNPLDVRKAEQVEPTVHSVMEMLDRQMQLSGQSAPRATNYATQAITALCEANLSLKDPETKCTMLHVVTFFLDTNFRQLVLSCCSNPSILEQYDPDTGPFENMSEKQRVEHIGPILRAFQPLGNSEAFANVFSSGENRLNFTDLILDNKIIILKLSRFSHQKQMASFVGSLTIPYLLQSMNDWGRTQDPDTKEWKGRGCRLIIDEAPTVCGPKSSIVEVAAEARKWDLGFVAMAQFPQQLDREVEKSLYVNTASKISLVLDPQGVGGMAGSLDGGSNLITQQDIISLPNYYAYANVLFSSENGKEEFNSGPFSMATLPPMMGDITAEHRALAEQVMDRSHAIVCNPREEIQRRRRELTTNLKTAFTQLMQERNLFTQTEAAAEAASFAPGAEMPPPFIDDPFADTETPMKETDLFDPNSYKW